QGSIVDDDAAPKLSIAGPSADVDEGKDATFTVTLDAASGKTVTVKWTAGNVDTESSDYSAASGTLTFAPGDVSETITVKTTNDNDPEPAEDFKVTLSEPANATIATADDTATIADND
ncbi:MAG TPA: Calx-beta domain-containing protein, partial [Dermatophilaceae bacterium]|nr:Calx-beta domain-containing protein [Dermatophilaceae bacterium]